MAPISRTVEHELVKLNEELRIQNSYGKSFVRGIYYGVGFFVGSAIIAVILLGIFGPIVNKFQIIRESYKTGTEILHPLP